MNDQEEKVDFVDDVKNTGHRFEKGNTYGFKGHPENINYSGGPKTKIISEAYKELLARELHDPIMEEKVVGYTKEGVAIKGTMLGQLEGVARHIYDRTGEKMSYAQLLALGMIVSAFQGNSTAAKEVREVTEGRLPERIDLSGKIDYNAGAEAKDILAGKLVKKDEEPTPSE